MADEPRTLILDQNIENEQIILGAMFSDTKVAVDLLPRLQGNLFVSPVHQEIVAALGRIVEMGAQYSADTVVQLCPSGDVNLSYLKSIEEAFGPLPAANLDVHLGILRRDFVKYQAVGDFERLFMAMDDRSGTLEEAESAALAIAHKLGEARGDRAVEKGRQLRERWEEDVRRRAATDFAGTYFSGLDDVLYEGLQPAKLTVLAARPSMGKSTWVFNFALRQAAHGRRWLVLPVEAGTLSVVDGMACAAARFPAEKLIKTPQQITDEEWLKLRRAVRNILDNENLHFADNSTMKLDEVECMLMDSKYDGFAMDLYEYLLPSLDAQDITVALRRTAKMAQRAQANALVVQQIRRIERRKDQRPYLQELKHSGGYEEVSDLVIMLHRDKYYDPDAEEDVLEMIVAKQRRGPRNVTVGFEFHPEESRIGRCIDGYRPGEIM